MNTSHPRSARHVRTLIARSLCGALLGALALGLAAPARSANPACYTKNDRVCPVAGSFDRCFGDANVAAPKPTVVGTLACDALNDGALVLERLGKGVDAAMKDTNREMQRAVDVVMKDAINPEAAASFVEARSSLGGVVDDVRGFTNDSRCGVRGSLTNVQRGLEQIGEHLMAAGEIAPRVGVAASQGLTAGVEVSGALEEIGALAGDLSGASESARAELARVKAALESASASLAELDRANAGKAFESGLALASTVGPFTLNCAACANLLVSAIGNAAVSIGSASAGGASCPETAGGGCVVGVPVAAITGVGAALSGAISATPCTSVTEDSARLGEYVGNIERFANASVAVAQSLGKTADALNDAAKALSKLAAEAPKSAEARIGRAQRALGRAADSINGGITTLEREVAPRVSRLAASMVQQMSDSVLLLTECWNRASALAAETGADTIEAVTLLGTASTQLIDGGRVYQNLASQSSKAIEAATAEARARYKAVDKSYGEVHRDLWGVSRGKTDLPKTAAHLASLVTDLSKLKELAKDVGTLADRTGKMVQASVQAGNDAFLDRDKLSRQARASFDKAAAEARKAKIALAKARAAAKRVEQRAATKPQPSIRVQSLDPALLKKRATFDTSSLVKK